MSADELDVIVKELPAAINTRRAGMSFERAAAESGIPAMTLCRLERGGTPNARTLIKVLRWCVSTPQRPQETV